MNRSEHKGNRLKKDCLAVTPLSESAVAAIYGMQETLPKHAVDNLCKSHERLRAELSGAEILLDYDDQHAQLLARAYRAMSREAWQDGETIEEVRSAINYFMSDRHGPKWDGKFPRREHAPKE